MDSIKKWDDILEEVLQCCVCLEVSNLMILQCTNGHHICHFCRSKLQQCPICHACFIETRNLVVEDLISRMNDIKLAIGKEMMERLEQLKCGQQFVNTSTQTDVAFKKCSTTQTNKMTYINNEQKNNNTPKQKVLYPCLGSCMLNLSYYKLMQHLNQHHKDTFYKICQNKKIFSKHFMINVDKLPKNYDYAFYITNMGLFFVKITIHNNGQLYANLQLVDKNVETAIFEYRIIVAYGEHVLRRRGMVTSCLIDKEIAYQNSACMKQKEMSRILQKKLFDCTIIIKRCEYPSKIIDTRSIK